MAQVFPFRAYRYDPARVELGRVLTQPYDKITSAMQEKYYAADPHNLVVIEKGRASPNDTPQDNVYTRAAGALERWIAEGTVAQDVLPSLYAYFQDFAVPGAEERERHTRKGFIGLGRLENYSAGIVFRHEQTLSAPKADRLDLLRHTRAQTGQLFMLYSDPERRVDALLDEAASSAPPAVDVGDEYGVAHRLWPIADPARVAAIQQLMAPLKLVIADGHHRYETALAYRDERRTHGSRDSDAAYERAMMTFVNTHSEGLTILPTHRLVINVPGERLDGLIDWLSPYFSCGFHPFSDDREKAQALEQFRSHFESKHGDGRLIGCYARRAIGCQPAFHVFVLKPDADLAAMLPQVSPLQRQLDVVLLHGFILEKCLGITEQAVTAEKHIVYEREMEAAVAAVDRGAAQLAFLLNPVAIEQVMRIATAGEVMPQKSTDFYPKLLSGITIYHL